MSSSSKSINKTVLCVEDEAPIRDMIRFSLEREGYTVQSAESGQQMLDSIKHQHPDLILMDWMLPDTNGPQLIKSLRKDTTTRHIPIIMLTAKSEEADMIKGLEVGADDYVSKPVSLKYLNARIKALLRRTDAYSENESLDYDLLSLDLSSLTLSIDSEETAISSTELNLLTIFMKSPERVFSRSQLLDLVWGQNSDIDERTVDVHILRLRKLLKPNADYLIKTVRGSGYKLSK